MDHATLTLPRSVLLALWLQQADAGAGPAQQVLDAVQGDDEPHTVDGHDAGGPTTDPRDPHLPGGATLGHLVTSWAGGRREAVAVLPAPGDPAGAPSAVGHEAQEAGEAVLVHTGDAAFAAVPFVETFGSVYEPGHLVRWRVRPVPDWRAGLVGQIGTLPDAERDLRLALTQATHALASLDVARWRPDAADAIATLRGNSDPGWRLPAGIDARRVRVLVTAARLRAIVALATSDDGGAVNLWQADQRSAALREIDRAARRAMSAATQSPPAPRAV
ncbi:hypothetical protein [Cellulomonas hominis]